MTHTLDDLLLTLPVAVPMLASGASILPIGRRVANVTGLASPVALLACGVVLATVRGHTALTAYGHLLRADSLSIWMLLVIGGVAAVACAAGPAYLAGERLAGRIGDRDIRRYHQLVHLFLGAMTAAVLAENLGVLWVAVEATTIVTAFLVGHRHTRRSIEAAWKYVVICSAGIALAFLGTVLIYYAARQAGLSEAGALDWPTLAAHAHRLDPGVTRLGVGLILLGFGTKAGLVPLHAWLPDAHSQAPAPVSALMSGVLLSVAFSAILRYKVIADAALGPGFVRFVLGGTAMLTLALAAGMLQIQRDYKRMLAYSSMEHMSLIALGTAVGNPAATAAVLLHIAGHGLVKSVAFCSAGSILHLRHTTLISEVRELLARVPVLGACFGIAVLALLGLPPFSLFPSEIAIVKAGFSTGMAWPTALALLLVLAAFAALAHHTRQMLLGPLPDAPGTPAVPLRIGAAAGAPLVLGLVGAVVLGITTGPLTHLLHNAAAIIGGH